jgi:hypothetical protein
MYSEAATQGVGGRGTTKTPKSRVGGIRWVKCRQRSNPNVHMSKQMLIRICDSAEKYISSSMRPNSYLYSPPNVIECLMRGETKPRESYRD